MTLPNLITLARLALIPFLVFALEVEANFIALGIFLLASTTDWIDGYLARKLDQESALGSLLDPLVDKLLVAAALIGLVRQDIIPAWTVTVVLGREFLITGLRTAAINAGIVLAASWWGKVKTVTQMVAIAMLLANLGLAAEIGWAIAVIATIGSGIEYLWGTRSLWKRQQSPAVVRFEEEVHQPEES